MKIQRIKVSPEFLREWRRLKIMKSLKEGRNISWINFGDMIAKDKEIINQMERRLIGGSMKKEKKLLKPELFKFDSLGDYT